jgi:hypothetical protein
MPLRQMLAAARSHQTPVLEEKPRSPEGAHEREGRSFTCPSAAVTTAATLGTKFERNIYTGQHGEFQSSVNIGPEDVRAFIERSNRSRSKRFAAIRFFRKLLRGAGQPRVIVTDKLRSYAAAKRIVMPGVAHRQHRYLNNRAENSHQPTRERERRMRRFKSAGHAQRFVEVHGIIASHFRPRRHLLSAADYRTFRTERIHLWNEVTRATALA